MPKYDFRKEIEYFASTGQFTEKFFDKLEKLAVHIVRERPFLACFVDPVAVSWSQDTYRELAYGFYVNFLCAWGNKRLLNVTKNVMVMMRDVDFLFHRMFVQYRDELVIKHYPYRANLNDRIRAKLDTFTQRGVLETRVLSYKEYRRVGAKDISLKDENLKDIEIKLPKWRLIPFNTDSQFASAIISNEELELIIAKVFQLTDGWIANPLLNAFLHRFLKLPEVAFVSNQVKGIDGNDISLEEIVASAEIQSDPSLLTKIKMAYEEMSPRQQNVFLLLCRGYNAIEISSKISASKSTIFNEIREVIAITKEHLSG